MAVRTLPLPPPPPLPTAAGWRSYVLCVGMLMIILDGTIVNVALPSIQTDLGFSAVEPGLGRQRLPDPLRRPAAAGRPPRRPHRPQARVPHRPRRLRRGVAGLRPGRQPGAARRRPLRPGRRRRDDLRRHPRDDRDDVPRAARARAGHRGLQLRRLRGRVDRPAGRRGADRGDQLALDLLRQRADRHRRRRAGRAPHRARPRPRPRPRRRRRGRRPGDRRRSCSACYAIVGAADHGWGSARTLGVGALAVALLAGVRRARVAHRRPARAAAACCARATSRARTSSRSSWSPGCSGCSSWARCTSSASSGSTRSRSASPSCRCPCSSARCRCASPPAS